MSAVRSWRTFDSVSLSAPCHERTMKVSLISDVIVEPERIVSFWLDSDISSENQLLRCHVSQLSIHCQTEILAVAL